ncbi:hypothetical protein B0H13DRAFT_2318548 [Mycena leptocephala]|nr:hypothetical protein B0H13DRAFT_2318548 [Mycena leptocephala]
MAPIDISTSVYAGPTSSYHPVPNAIPSAVYHKPAPDAGLHQVYITMMIILVGFVLLSVYSVGKQYIAKWRAGNVVEDDEKSHSTSATFKPPAIALPPRSATFGRSDHWRPHHQQRSFYVSQADMLSGNGRGFFG